MLDFDEIARNIDLVEFVERDLGRSSNRSSRHAMFKCPFHEDTNPSMAVINSTKGKQYYRCFACGEWGDVLDYVSRRDGKTLIEAAKMLGGKEQIKFSPPKPKPQKAQRKQNFLPQVESLRENIMSALPFFCEERHISEKIAQARLLSIDDRYHYNMNKYRMVEGNTLAIECPRYIIPDFDIFHRVRSVNTRRNDKKALELLKSNNLLEVIRIDLAERTNQYDPMPSDTDCVEAICGPKYKTWTGSIRGLFNSHHLVRIVDGRVYRPHLSYVVGCESELDALAFETIGILAVAVKSLRGIHRAFHPNLIDNLFIFADNDPEKTRSDGRVFRAGDDIALETVIAANRMNDPFTKIIHPPKGWKGIGDFIAGSSVERALSFLKDNGISPVDQRMLEGAFVL